MTNKGMNDSSNVTIQFETQIIHWGSNYDEQPEIQKDVSCGPHNEKHIRVL